MLPVLLGDAATPVHRVLVLGAHCDDIEIGCGGTILRLVEQCAPLSVYWLVLSGSKERAGEAAASAAAFLSGADGQVVVRGFRDGFFPWSGAEIKEVFEELKGLVAPDVIFTHRREDAHQDHRLVAELTWNTFRDHLILEYEIPKYEGDLTAPNLFVPLDERTGARKVELLLKGFPSQRHRQWFDADAFWSILRLRGIESNSPTRYAEGFSCRKLVLPLHAVGDPRAVQVRGAEPQ
ncbi:MAG: PIG-L deacetylase family protein [Egibacteraceae bacterium]